MPISRHLKKKRTCTHTFFNRALCFSLSILLPRACRCRGLPRPGARADEDIGVRAGDFPRGSVCSKTRRSPARLDVAATQRGTSTRGNGGPRTLGQKALRLKPAADNANRAAGRRGMACRQRQRRTWRRGQSNHPARRSRAISLTARISKWLHGPVFSLKI